MENGTRRLGVAQHLSPTSYMTLHQSGQDWCSYPLPGALCGVTRESYAQTKRDRENLLRLINCGMLCDNPDVLREFYNLMYKSMSIQKKSNPHRAEEHVPLNPS